MSQEPRVLIPAIALSVALFALLYVVAGWLNLGPKSFIFAFAYGVVLFGLPLIVFLLLARVGKHAVFRAIQILVSLLVGISGLFPLAALFDAMQWPVFHSWGLGHGSFLIAIPLMAWPVYWVLGRAFRHGTRAQAT